MSQANFGPYMECSLALAVDLVNTEDPVSGREDLRTAADLAAFLRANELSNPGRPGVRDLEDVKRLRTTLRRVWEASDQHGAVAILNDMLATSGARPVLTDHDDGPWHLHYTPERTPLAPRLAAEAAMALAVVIAEDGFERLRTCESPTCRDVFVDESRNRSRRYCSPQVCGNRASVAAYRARRRAARAGGMSAP